MRQILPMPPRLCGAKASIHPKQRIHQESESIYCRTPSNDDLGVWRVAVSEFRCETETGSALPRFRLGRGSFANAVLRELVDGISGVSDV
jgi:hypothetical protein